MFYSFNRLIDDINIVFTGGSKKEDLPSNGAVEKGVKAARFRLTVQIVTTVLVIAVCALVVNSAPVRDTEVRAAHVGFGIVLGYWFR